ncbi:MAG: tetratricopeptide repeat protein [Chthoniobacter sp.]
MHSRSSIIRLGGLAEAEALYRQVLAAQGDHVEAWQLLGVLAHQSGHHSAAVELLGRALALHPQHPIALANLGEAYRALGRTEGGHRQLSARPANPAG